MDRRNVLINQLNQLDEQLELMLKRLSESSEEELNRSAGEGRWSALQAVNHLVMSERYSLAYCKKKLSYSPELSKATHGAWWRAFTLAAYLRSPLKRKAPEAIDIPALPSHDTLINVSTAYREHREVLRKFLEEVPEGYLDKAVYKHPFMGRLSLKGMLDFFDAHFYNHRRQAYKSLSEIG